MPGGKGPEQNSPKTIFSQLPELPESESVRRGLCSLLDGSAHAAGPAPLDEQVQALVTLLGGLAATRPLMLCCEDSEHIDSSSLAVLDQLLTASADQNRRTKLFVVVAVRSECGAVLGSWGKTTRDAVRNTGRWKMCTCILGSGYERCTERWKMYLPVYVHTRVDVRAQDPSTDPAAQSWILRRGRWHHAGVDAA